MLPIFYATVSCSADTAPTDGTRTAANADYLNTVTYDCNTGYTGGSVNATCQAGGTFDLGAPNCTIGMPLMIYLFMSCKMFAAGGS